jgi:hypothetical protein
MKGNTFAEGSMMKKFYFGLGWEKIYCGELNGYNSWGDPEKAIIQREVRS